MVVARSVSLDTLVEHLERLDGTAVVAMAEEAVGHGQAISEVIGSLLLPAWRVLEQRAGDGEMDQATIGAATAITRRALARAALVAGIAVAPGDRRPVMIVSSSSRADLLGADVVGEVVTAAGWPTDVLTGGPAAEEIIAHTRARRPTALIVTFVETTDLPAAARLIACAHSEDVPVITWGPAFGPDGLRAERLGADAWAPSLEVITSTLETWLASAPGVVATPVSPPGFTDLQSDRAALLIATAKISGGEGDANGWVQRTAERVIAHLSAAVLVGDSRILAEHLEAERRGLARDQLLDVHLLGLVDALAGALPEAAEPARGYVLAGRDDLRRALVSSRPRPAPGAAGRLTVSSLPARNLVVSAAGAPAQLEAVPSAANPGQLFADILLLAALSCQTPVALLSVPQSGGQWSTLSYGFDQRDGLNDPVLYNFVAARTEPVEIPDLSVFPGLSGSSLAAPPHSLRWVYAAPLRDASGALLGVVAVLDRWLREGSRREQRAMLAVTRQLAAPLSQRRQRISAPTRPTAPAPSAAVPPLLAVAAPGAERSNLVGLRRAVAVPEGQQLLRSHEVAVLFDVTERTVINWAAAGKLPSLRTIGGHLRFHSEDVVELLAGRPSQTSAARRAPERPPAVSN